MGPCHGATPLTALSFPINKYICRGWLFTTKSLTREIINFHIPQKF